MNQGYEGALTITKMADNNPPVSETNSTTNNEGGTATNGDNGRRPSHRDQKGSKFQTGRGGGGGRGRDQGRGGKKGFGSKSNDRGGRHKKGDLGRGEYKYVSLESSKFAQLTKQVAQM